MSYEPTNWKTGDVVTSAKLNKLETGVATAGMVATITIDAENISVSKTYDELVSAWENGAVVHGIITPHDGEGELYAMDFKPVFGFEMYTAFEDELDYSRIKYDLNTNKWVSETYSYSMTPYDG